MKYLFAAVVAVFTHGTLFAQTSKAVEPAAPAAKAPTSDLLRGARAQMVTLINSERDLWNHLTTASNSPLNSIPAPSRWEFIGSFVFTDKGLASFRYDILEKALTRTEAYDVLSLFGLQHVASMLEPVNSDPVSSKLELIARPGTTTNSCLPSTTPGWHDCPDPGEGKVCTEGNCYDQPGVYCDLNRCGN